MDKEDINQEYQLARWFNRGRGMYSNVMAAGTAKNAKKEENSHNLVRFCKTCNLFLGFRARKCWKCGNEDLELEYRRQNGINVYDVGTFKSRCERGIKIWIERILIKNFN